MDRDILNAIRAQLDGIQWSIETIDEIAATLIEAGFQIRDIADAKAIDQLAETEAA